MAAGARVNHRPWLGEPWTEAEAATLRASYGPGGVHAAMAALPGRTRDAINRKVIRMGIQRSRRRLWTAEEDERVRMNWGLSTIEEMALMLGRTRDAIFYRATWILKLPSGAPEGWEFLTHAADRVGYSRQALRTILRWAGVKLSLPYQDLRGKSPQARIVETIDIDDAVELWMKTETQAEAARRVGVGYKQLGRWIAEEQGKAKRLSKTPKSTLRIAVAETDRVVAAHRARESTKERIREGAIRHGLTPTRLCRWLRNAGVARARRFDRVERAVIDSVVATERARLGLVMAEVA